MTAPRAHAGTPSSFAGQTAASAPQKWNLEWLDSFKGKHKQVYDLMWHTLRSNTLNPPMNYFDVHKELSRLEFPDVNVVIGANSTGFPINASDALWAKYKLGERYNIKDPGTGQPAIRNVYLGRTIGETRSTVRTLQARGAVFMMCNNALNGIAAEYAHESGATASDVHAELIAGLNPGVKVVPALTWAVGALQERGFTYEKL
jgi:hypothetical protein